ncbi:hypothetical protein BDF20DRAFT_905963 [Mycotypha africana]|uniref:uncharacterized protein n=1 Tax=Mycotypha africana TaxID=64632 RepID=UPI0022FFE3B7|nr:uncharacterized protein BDF20DRAFT_905963 [Mycotypha africana]KAI8979202.1 hypothetical protein BDF20DRAFT_905963 [Mycotypha africana]
MEKYSKWRDPGTGIQPFLPPVTPRVDSNFLAISRRGIRLVVGSMQGIVRISLIAMVTLLYILLVPISGSALTIIPPLKRYWNNVWTGLLLRLALFLMGFFHIKTETLSIRKSRESNHAEKPKVQHGDIIIANWTSYIDILYLAYKYNPIFTQVFMDSDKVKVIGLWEAIQLTGKMPVSKPSTVERSYTVKELSDKAKRGKWGPVVVFPEGTTANGRALLKFAPLFQDYSMDQNDECFKIMSFKKTNLSMSDKCDFLVYYKSRNIKQ